MIPLKDDAPRITTPYVTWFLLVANVAVFLFELIVQQSHQLNQFIFQFGIVPERIDVLLAHGGTVPHDVVAKLGTRFIGWPEAIVPIFTSMFLHGSWLHLIGNMLALWIFGDNVEDHFGHALYLFMYLLSGVGGALVHIAFNLNSTVPSVGASGAIAGVMGAYILLYPSARVLTLVPFFFVFFVWLPAWVVLGFWFLGEFLSGAATAIVATDRTTGGVAFWAHVGGFIGGMVLVKVFPARPRRYRYYGH